MGIKKKMLNNMMVNNKKRNSILLVEDEILVAVTEKLELEKRGYCVTHVTAGEDAIKSVMGENPSFDLILMDIELGGGIDGTQAAVEISKISDIPLIFLSSHMEPEIVSRTERLREYR